MAGVPDRAPALSIVIPTFNNEAVLRECLESWRHFGGDDVEIVVVEDGSVSYTHLTLPTILRV